MDSDGGGLDRERDEGRGALVLDAELTAGGGDGDAAGPPRSRGYSTDPRRAVASSGCWTVHIWSQHPSKVTASGRGRLDAVGR